MEWEMSGSLLENLKLHDPWLPPNTWEQPTRTRTRTRTPLLPLQLSSSSNSNSNQTTLSVSTHFQFLNQYSLFFFSSSS